MVPQDLKMKLESKKITLIFIIFISLVAGYSVYKMFFKPEETLTPGFEVGNTLIDLEIPNIKGGSIKLSEFNGDIIIIDFMAPWCPPCKEQFKIFKQLDQNQVKILTINVDPRYNTSSLLSFAEKEGVTWFFGHLPEAAISYQVSAIPIVILADSNSVIRYRGFYTPLETLQSLIEQFT
jgi:thiol-disulfide isomerase/thioredoxin